MGIVIQVDSGKYLRMRGRFTQNAELRMQYTRVIGGVQNQVDTLVIGKSWKDIVFPRFSVPHSYDLEFTRDDGYPYGERDFPPNYEEYEKDSDAPWEYRYSGIKMQRWTHWPSVLKQIKIWATVNYKKNPPIIIGSADFEKLDAGGEQKAELEEMIKKL